MKTIGLTLLSLCLWGLTTAFSQTAEPQRSPRFPSFIHLSQPVSFSEWESLVRRQFQMTADDELRLIDRKADELGYLHEKYQQYYRGIPVDGSAITLHGKNGQVELITGNYRKVKDLNTKAAISRSAAISSAFTHVNARAYLPGRERQAVSEEGELVIMFDPGRPGSDEAHLAYKFDIYAVDPLYRAYVYVDAQTGNYLRENSRIHHTDILASGESLYNGNVAFTADFTGEKYRLRQTANGDGIETYTLKNGTNYSLAADVVSPKLNFKKDPTAVQAHWGAEQTFLYYSDQHDRNSFDDNGGVISSYVHYGVNFVNAFWDGERMTYGDGDGVVYNPLVSLDVVGHEITHGVTQYAANLEYFALSGALNESFSDIFAEAVEWYATGTNDWRIGTDIGIGKSGAIRAMDDPNLFENPDTYLGDYWYSGSGDNGGVHYNSGVPNKWFYLLSEGEDGVNDNGDAYSVEGIGLENAAAIAYRNLTVYLFPTAGFYEARQGAIQAAVDLFGEGSAEEIAVTNAWYAVGVGAEYGSVGSYCESASYYSDYLWIGGVEVGDFQNNSGAANYSDFTDLIIELEPGEDYPITLYPDFDYYEYYAFWRVWIDFNADGDFFDEGEMVFESDYEDYEPVRGTISIPDDAAFDTRMRVSMSYDWWPEPCEFFYDGEVEDYSVSVGESDPLTLEIVDQHDVSCFGGSDGSATAAATGGKGAYTYRWNNGAEGPVATGLAAGTYRVTASDGRKEKSASVIISDPAPLQLEILSFDATRPKNGAAMALVSGGVSGYQYLWSNGATTEKAEKLAPGNHRVTVTDANGCRISGSVRVKSVDPVYDAGITEINGTEGEVCGSGVNPVVKLKNFSNTQLTTTRIKYKVAGKPWNDFQWDGYLKAGGATYVSLPEIEIESGEHQFIARTVRPNRKNDHDTSNDELEKSFTGKPHEMTLTINLDYYPYNTHWRVWDSNGEIIASGGPYDYNDGNSAVTETFCLSGGSYNLGIYDSWGDGICCFGDEGSYQLRDGEGNLIVKGGEFFDFDITNFIVGDDPGLLSLKIVHQQDISCAYEDDGAATAQASGGARPYTYKWSTRATGPSVSDLDQGSYAVTVTDAKGSTAVVSANFREPDYIYIYWIRLNDYIECGDEEGGYIEIQPSGGTGEFAIVWTGPDGFTATGPIIENLAKGTYIVQVTDENGCSEIDYFEIYDPNSTYYADADGDGYGDPATAVRACGAPAGYVSNNLDCNDASADSYPGAEEICDGIDNNCDGQVDENGALRPFYFDNDKDGYGDPATAVYACEQPFGYVDNGDDCNDKNSKVNPGAPEVCDGIDNNCDGVIDEDCPTVTGKGLAGSAPSAQTLNAGKPTLADFGMTIFPNPARGQLSITFDLPEIARTQLLVTDASGRVCHLREWTLDQGRQEFQFDGGDLPPGVYFFRLQVNDRQFTRKVVLMP